MIKKTLCRGDSRLKPKRVGRTRWMMIACAGYCVTFRFASKRELRRGEQGPGFRYVATIDPLSDFSGPAPRVR